MTGHPPGGGPPEERPPWPAGGHQQQPYRPPAQGVQAGQVIGGLVIGFVVGLVASVVCFVIGAGLSDSVDSGSSALLFIPQLVPIGLAVVLLAVRATRRAGAGLVMGIAIGAIVMPGVCVTIFGLGSSAGL